MRKILALIFILSCYANAQFGTVSGTVTDGAGQPFKNGTYKVELVPAFGFGNAVRTDTGLPVTPTQVFGTLDNTGSFAGVVLTRTDFIGPAGALWKWTVCADATYGCIVFTGVITTAAPSLTAQLSAAAGTIVVGTNYIKNIIPTAYTSTELFGMTKGSLYFNTTNNHLFGYDGSIWNDLTGSSVAACATVNNLCKSDGAGGFLNSTVVENGTNVTTTLPILLPTGIVTAPALQWAEATANAGLWRNGVNTYEFSIGNSTNEMRWQSGNPHVTINTSLGFALNSTHNTAATAFITEISAAYLVFGKAASASPASHTIQVGESATGANVAGAVGQINCGGAGTGTAGGGTCTFATAIAHGSDSVLDSFVAALTLDKNQLVTANVSFTSPHVAGTTDLKIAGSQALTGVQGTTGTNVFSCTGSFTSGNFVKTDANGNCVDGGITSGLVTLDKQDPVAGTAGTGADATIYTYSMPVNTMASGKCVEIEFYYLRSAGAGNPTFKIFFGATAVASYAATIGSGPIKSVATVCNNTGSTTAQWGFSEQNETSSGFNATTTSPAENTGSGSIIIKGTFNVSAATSVAGKGWKVKLLP